MLHTGFFTHRTCAEHEMGSWHPESPQRLAATGFGEYQPLAAGETAEARAKNRRIELKLTER